MALPATTGPPIFRDFGPNDIFSGHPTALSTETTPPLVIPWPFSRWQAKLLLPSVAADLRGLVRNDAPLSRPVASSTVADRAPRPRPGLARDNIPTAVHVTLSAEAMFPLVVFAEVASPSVVPSRGLVRSYSPGF